MKVKMRSSCLSKRVLAMPRAYAARAHAAITHVLAAVVLAVAVTPAPAASDPRPICVVVPHFKDEYWLSVGFGLVEEARETETAILLYESGGYHALARQIELLDICVERQARAILLGAVSADDPTLLAAVERTSHSVPVVALVNELRSDHLSGAVGVDWGDMGRVIGRFLHQEHPAGSPPVAAALVTGPAQSGWSPLLEAGLWEGTDDAAVTFDFVGRSDTGLREQLTQVEQALIHVDGLSMIVGSAPAIEGAMGLAANADGAFPQLVSTYISHSVRRGLQNGTVKAVAFDDPVEQGRLGIRLALQAQVGTHSRDLVGPDIVLVNSDNATAWQIELAPADLMLRIE